MMSTGVAAAPSWAQRAQGAAGTQGLGESDRAVWGWRLLSGSQNVWK